MDPLYASDAEWVEARAEVGHIRPRALRAQRLHDAELAV
jgi:hypothetical protein